MDPVVGGESLRLPAESRSAARARRFTADTLTGWGLGDLVEVSTLLVSELVTNALLHARTPMTVRCRREGPGVRVEVEDGSSVPPRVRRYGADSSTGRGLALVDRLAADWGTRRADDGGKCVWFVLLEGGNDAWAPGHLDALDAS